MPRPTSMTGWWRIVLDKRTEGNVGLFASLCRVSTRTLHRWASGNIAIPDAEHRKLLRDVAGVELLEHPLCPKCLRVAKVKPVGRPSV